MRDRKNVLFFKKQDPDPGSGFKILIFRIRIWPKMDRIRNPAINGMKLTKTLLKEPRNMVGKACETNQTAA